MDPSGKVALVTGGAGGLGKAFSRALISAGAKVVVADADEAAGRRAVEELDAKFGAGKAIFVKADVTNSDQLEGAFTAAKKKFNGLDIVVNNAGIMKDSVWRKQIDINLNGVVNGVLLAFKHMGKKEGGGPGGLVVNIASVAGLRPVPTLPMYCATKHAVIALTRSYGDPVHLEPTGVRVLALCPGAVDTPLYTPSASILNHDYLKPAWDEIIRVVGEPNKPDFIAEGLMKTIREGENGSVWVADRDKIYNVSFPELRSD